MMNTVVAFGHNRLDYIKRRIIDAHTRLTNGGSEWVEGSLDLASALRDGREAMPENIAFKDWLKENGFNHYNKNNRAALIGLASDIDEARAVLTQNVGRSYQLIWAENKSRFPNARKTVAICSPTNRKRRTRTVLPGRKQLFRTMKLGEDVMDRIKGTSLDRPEELDELVILNRGAPIGEHTEVVKRLIDAAAAGEDVSAVAESVAMGGRRSPASLELMRAWKQRMNTAWKLASEEQRTALVHWLAQQLNPESRPRLIEKIWDEEQPEEDNNE
jgi:hypothetical protein